MTKRPYVFISVLIASILNVGVLYGASLEDYLILNDIGDFKRKAKVWDLKLEVEKPIPGYWIYSGPSKEISFAKDHNDVTYETEYFSEAASNYAEVQVTQHAGGEFDGWLLHELEGTHRFDDDDKGLVGMLQWGTVMFNVNGQRVLFKNGRYQWISGTKLIEVATDIDRKPFEQPVFQAYLAKHHSTITMTDSEMKSVEHTRLWLRDEVERRLWLSDKWLEAFAAGKVEVKDLQYELNDNMKVVLLITGKYYDKSVARDIERLEQYYYFARDTEGIKKLLAELKAWWTEHKSDTPDVLTYDEVIKRQDELFK